MTFKVATFNLWHGLNGDSSIHMDNLEPKGRKFLRQNNQRDLLRDLAADVLFLQEVNPCPTLSADLADHLKRSEIHQVDNAGVRLLSVGFPKKLRSGITVLARKDFNLTFLESIKLSGPRFSFCNDFLSLQLHEHRFCLFGEISHPDFGRLLLINFHLHHGLELTRLILQKFEDFKNAKFISQSEYSRMIEVGQQAQKRRIGEIEVLKNAINRIYSPQKHQGIILAGDLNCSEDSEEWKILTGLGFTDSSYKVHGPNSQFTWNYEENKINHDFDKNFHFPWQLTNTFFTPAAQDILRQALMENEFRKRRIDYIFTRTNCEMTCVATSLFANHPNKHGLIASDHFGVVGEFKI